MPKRKNQSGIHEIEGKDSRSDRSDYGTGSSCCLPVLGFLMASAESLFRAARFAKESYR